MAGRLAKVSRIGNPALFICDMQEIFRSAIYEFPKIISTSQKMLQACSPLRMPVYITTQNRARLGETVSELQPYLSGSHVRADVDKTLFSMITPEIKEKFPVGDPLDAVIVGIETHICVTQTALDLLFLGHRVYVLADGVSSINPQERGIALARLRDAGAVVTTSESILFEILGDAKREGFKEINQLVKSTKGETKAALEALCDV